MTHKYTTARILTTTHRLLKIESAKRSIPLSTLLDQAVMKEIKPKAKTIKTARVRRYENGKDES